MRSRVLFDSYLIHRPQHVLGAGDLTAFGVRGEWGNRSSLSATCHRPTVHTVVLLHGIHVYAAAGMHVHAVTVE